MPRKSEDLKRLDTKSINVMRKENIPSKLKKIIKAQLE